MSLSSRVYGILSTSGRDQLGIVASVSSFLETRGANIESGHGVRLGNTFFLHLQFSVDRPQMGRISSEYGLELASLAPSLTTVPKPYVDRDAQALHYELSVWAYDDEGIVSSLTTMLAEQDVDIVELAGCVYPAPKGGTPLFVTQMKLDVPNNIAVRNIRRALYELERHLGWDHDFRPDQRASLEVSPTTMYPPSRWGKWYRLPTPAPLSELAEKN
jgi:glycine cleavage system regulatory protein